MRYHPTSAVRFTFPGLRQALRWIIPILLVLLFLSTLLWLPWQAQQMEATERQEQLIADTLWVEQTIRLQLGRDEENLRSIGSEISSGILSGGQARPRMQSLIRSNRELTRILWLDAADKLLETTDETPASPMSFAQLTQHSKEAAKRARTTKIAQYSQPAAPDGFSSPILMDYHVPLYHDDHYIGSLVASFSVFNILDSMVPWWFAQDNEIALADSDDKIMVRRAAGGAGRGVYTHQHVLDLPGAQLTLHTNSIKSAPKLLPNLLVGSVIALSIGLVWSLWALWRDITKRQAAEDALRQQVAFRTAMENSLITGMRARDREGRVTYVNPAFCHMVGFPAEEILGKKPPMPYWAPEATEDYQQRFSQVLAGTVTPNGFETVFQRANGERVPVLIFESPLVDDIGRQTGWMGSILDISELKRIEELNRQQQEKLQSSARLATMGEMASALAHELNQPLAAISSYTTGALNLLTQAPPQTSNINTPTALISALEKANAQAQRAGQIIRSVHTFVKKRAPSREGIAIDALIDSVMPLIELQAKRLFVSIQTDIPSSLPLVLADRTLLEQVLLNLTRNAIEAMHNVAPQYRQLCIVAEYEKSSLSSCKVIVSVIDRGHGIAGDVAERLFSPFFSTKAEGMGIGLNICRTAIEFHGGTLTHLANPLGGTIFRFTLPEAAVPL